MKMYLFFNFFLGKWDKGMWGRSNCSYSSTFSLFNFSFSGILWKIVVKVGMW